MKQSIILVGLIGAAALAPISLLAQDAQEPQGEVRRHERPIDETTYAIGYEAGAFILSQIRADGVEADIDSLVAGLQDAVRENEPQVEPDRMRSLLQALEEAIRAQTANRLSSDDPVFKALSEANLARSTAYHEEFGASDGVVTLENGLQYMVIDAGEGEPPTIDDRAIVTFEARLLDGFEVADGDEVELVVADVMDGGRETLLRMRPGARWRVAVPPELAFGALGRDPDIGPYETIILDVELHEVIRD